uniref:Uncharacterized protein n=1 Tax=Avena sativa TaxID=4498 RepID=A0ACD6AKQ8_AVESA
MRDPAPVPQGADPSCQSMACLDARELRCSAVPDNPKSKVLDGDNTSSWSAPATPLEDEDLLQEILLRLPPQASSLPRASLVCTRWRNILSDPKFLKRFRKHHQKPPLLGFFAGTPGCKHKFVPNLDKPNRVPAERFAVPNSSSLYDDWNFRGCRHGLAVLLNDRRRELVVWDPLTGQQHRVPFPPGLCTNERVNAWHCDVTVLCANVEDGHVHGDCFSSPLKLVLMCGLYTQAFAWLYESTSGLWGNIVSTASKAAILCRRTNVVTGNAVYGLFCGGDCLVFDIERQTLGVMKKPTLPNVHTNNYQFFQLLRTDYGSGLGFAVLSKLSIHLWGRKMNSDGVAGWVLQPKIIQLEAIFPQITPRNEKWVLFMGYDEDNNVILLTTSIGKFMLQLESMQIKKISETHENRYMVFYPYANFYIAGREVGWKWLDLKL